MSDSSKKKKAIYFQTVHLEIHNPITNKTEVFSFIGKAMWTPEQAEKLKEVPLAEVLKDIGIDEPYNPFEDERNTRAQNLLIERIRETLNKEDG